MKVIYKELPENLIWSKVDTLHPLLVLVNKMHWFVKSFSKKSIYMGYWFEKDGEVYKLISDINFLEEIEKIEIIDEKSVALFSRDNNIINLNLEDNFLEIQAIKPVFLEIYFDGRKLYSNLDEGQIYNFIPGQKSFYLNFFQEKEKFNLNAIIEFEGDLQFINEFFEEEFDFDKERNSTFFEFKILKAFRGHVTQLKVTPDFKNSDENIEIQEKLNPLKKFILKRILSLYDGEKLRAGLFWFPQRWFRDELLTLIFLDFEKAFKQLKEKILNYYLNNLENIWDKNKEKEYIVSADTLLLLLNLLDEETINKNYKSFLNYFRKWQEKFFEEGINLPPRSTWMDTKSREKALEIELMYLRALEKLQLFDEFKKYKVYLKTKIFTNSYPKEEIISPNAFLGYYFYKNFWEEHEWLKIFDEIIKNYYLPWGGFSSESKNSPNFFEYHTGENSLSYHSGDSWFWLNNLSAYVLKNFAPKKYEEYVKKIQEASLINLFNLGSLGYMSELSSAKELKAEGCPVQLWSLSSLYLCL